MMYDRFLELLLEAKNRTKSQKAAARRKKNVAAQQAAAQQKKSSGDRTVAPGSRADYMATAKPRPQMGSNQQKKPTQALVPYQGGETDQRALVPSTTRAVVPSTTRAVVPVRPEIQGQGNRKPIKFRDPGEQDAVVSPARVPFNRAYRRVLGALKGARPIVGMKPKGVDVSPVTNAFNIGKDPERTIAGTQRQQNKQDDKKPDSRTAAVKNILKGLTGRKSMRNRPSYNP